MDNLDNIRKQAEMLAKENIQAEPTIQKILWFPHPQEVRLVELDTNMQPSLSGSVDPFYFGASVAQNLPSPSGIALIRPEEYMKLELPQEWGGWSDAKELDINK